MTAHRRWPRLRRPLEGVSSIKMKLSILIVVAVGMTAVTSQIGLWLGWPVWVRPIVAGSAALLMVQFLARGMTKPLRRMAEATTAMAEGDYSRRVTTNGNDEVARLARSFNAMAGQMAETDRVRKEFVANASHELRTPVAALRSTLENLVDGVGQPDAETLGRMLARAEHLSNLVGQLLDLSRLDSVTDLTDVRPIDMGDLLHDVADEIRLVNPRAEIIVRSPFDLKVEGQPGRLRQVFVNVVGNAVRFSHPGEPVVVTLTQNNGSAGVSVRDTGPGIPAEERDRVFERFWQAGGTARTGAGGAGLGLAISKQIVDQHGGTIEVRPNNPRGACFVVTLPRRQPVANGGRRTPIPTGDR
ncbi:MAG: HAMP domain-containing sensor histidine kinase [Actinomycetota bacterium]